MDNKTISWAHSTTKEELIIFLRDYQFEALLNLCTFDFLRKLAKKCKKLPGSDVSTKEGLVKLLCKFNETEILQDFDIDTLRQIVKYIINRQKKAIDKGSRTSTHTDEVAHSKNLDSEGKEQAIAGAASANCAAANDSVNASSISNVSDSDSDDDMTSETKIFFRLRTDDWESFIDKLELHFIVKKIDEAEMKRAMLLTHCDDDSYKLFSSLCAPVKPATKTYEELKKMMSEHIRPKPSEVMERCKFNRAKQETNESVAEFAARLRQLSLHCNFASLDNALRDQFVCGIQDESTRVELFKLTSLTFDTAYKEAVARESAVKNAAGASKSFQQSSHRQDNFVIDHQRKSHQQSRYQDGRGRGTQQGPRRQTSCYCCGAVGHTTNACRFRNVTCNFCKIKGHMERVCFRKKKRSNKFLQEGYSSEEDDDVDENIAQEQNNFFEFFNIDYFNNKNNAVDPMFISVVINNQTVNMEIDTGTYFSVMSEKFVNNAFANLRISHTPTRLVGYENNKMNPLGQLKNLQVKLNGEMKSLNCLILKGDKAPLIGRQWLAAFGLWPLNIPYNTETSKKSRKYINKLIDTKEKLINEFKKLFDSSPGVYNKRQIKLHLKPNTKPVAFAARHVPYALKPKVEEELQRLIEMGHLEKVNSSEWATPIVPVQKSNGKIRVCGDFKITLNPNLQVSKHLFPRIDDIFEILQHGLSFSELDLAHAYMQIPVADESRDPLTITTHIGLFRYTKLTEGTACAPAEFQQIMNECLQGIPNTIAYLDNIYVTGKTEEEHFENLRAVCKRLSDAGLRLNKDKCEFMKERIEVLGFVIDKNGLHKAKSKVKAMYEAPRPENSKQLASFLGLINFYARFLENRAEKLKPLFECAKNKEFTWTKECEEAFRWVKNELISPKVLAHYDPNVQLVLACDASHYGLSAILSHRYDDGSERPIAYASKRIPDKELNRAINDKEAAAIIFGFMKFYDFVYGREIILRTDHKPLETIFGPKRGIPLTAASRLQRWAYFLSGFQYTIEWVKSAENANCDALSRLPIQDETDTFGSDFTPVNFISESDHVIDWHMILKETKRDKMLSKIIKFCIFGWPANSKDLDEEEKKYLSRKDELAVEEGCLFWGVRIVVPERLRGDVLNDFHASHLGIVKIKALARSFVWWPGIDADIENIVKSCKICVENQKSPVRAIPTPWPWPSKPWERIHADFLGPFYGDMYLVVIDAHSKWPEVVNFKQNTKAIRLIEVFQELFIRHGLPDHVVTDNGRNFASTDFHDFLKRSGVKHSFSPPYHPATNGAAENFVGTFKDKIKKIVQGGENVGNAIRKFLFDYRNTPHCTTGTTPAKLMYNRELKTRFDLLRPQLRERINAKQEKQIATGLHLRKTQIDTGDTVMIDNHGVSGGKRILGKVCKQLSPSTFQIETESGAITKRHTDQIVVPVRRSERLAKKANLPI